MGIVREGGFNDPIFNWRQKLGIVLLEQTQLIQRRREIERREQELAKRESWIRLELKMAEGKI